MLSMDRINIGGTELNYHIFGSGKVNLVIEMGLGAAAGEWYQLAQRLSDEYTVLLYERCRSTDTERSPRIIADELHALLGAIDSEEKVIILAHSQGGLYAMQFAKSYPETVRGLVLIDPLSVHDGSFRTEFPTAAEQRKSGFDKSANLVIMHRLAKLHLGFIIKAVLKKAPPFFYYDGFTEDERTYILSSLTNPALYTSALEEYRLAHDENELSDIISPDGFPDIPLILITHTSEFSVKEIMEFGNTDKAFADHVESFWQSLMKEYLAYSPQSVHIQAANSGHFIHLTEPALIADALKSIKE